MGEEGDLKLAETVGKWGAKMMKEYIAEMRRQGRIKGKLYVRVKEGRTKVELPYREK